MFGFWREQGLFLTFCKNRKAVFFLLIGQVFLRSIATMFYVLIFLIFASVYFNEWIPSLLISLPFLTFFLSVLCGVFSLALLLLPFSPRDLNAVVGASVFVFLFLNALTFHGDGTNLLTYALNLINPIYFNAQLLDFLNGGTIDSQTGTGLAISAIIFFTVGMFGLIHFRPHPIIARL
jgi:ABC-type polysaccharide/polyol phosphate export permease